MARPKKVEEKQLAPAVPQPVPIAAPQPPQQQPQQPNLVGNNLQGRVIDVDNFIKVRNSVSRTPPPTLFCRRPMPTPTPTPMLMPIPARLPSPLPSPQTALPVTQLHLAPAGLLPTPSTTALFTGEPAWSITACPPCL